MEIIKVEKRALVMDKTEIVKLEQICGYCNHRVKCHPESGARFLDGDFISYLRKFLKDEKGEGDR